MTDWFYFLAVQGTLNSLPQHHTSKASSFQGSAFSIVQLSHPFMTTQKIIAWTRKTFVGKVMSLFLNMLSSLVITFFPRSKCLLISWLQSPSSVFPRIRLFSNELVLHMRWPKYWSFSFSISPSFEYSGLISFRIDWLDLLVVQGTLENLQHHSSEASILWCSAFFIAQYSHPYVTTGKP